jgi:hypothetical protein
LAGLKAGTAVGAPARVENKITGDRLHTAGAAQ